MAQPANLLPGPEPVETAELHFKLHCRLKVFETNTKYAEGHCCILAVSQYYGLIFVGNLKGFSVISTKSLTPGISLDEYPKKNIVLNLRPTHISVDISQKILAVVCHLKPGSVIVFYNIESFNTKIVSPFKVTSVSKLVQNPTAQVVDLIWQPNADGSFVVCMSDGSVLAFPKGTQDESMHILPASIQATCFCWSPKGKQIVIGSANGTLSQYKPDLKLVKTLPSPPLYNGAVMVVSVLWVSSFQFAVAYNDRANPEPFPVITIVNAAKNEPVSVINYDDITYSSTLFRNHQIYMSHLTNWNLIFVSSANSIEIAVLHLKDNISWEQWLLGDASRAELPLNPDRQETFPLGWAFDFTSQETIPWGEGSLPPMPRLLLVSDEGLLCVFNVVNVSENAPQLCAPPQEGFDDSVFTVSSKSPSPAAPEPENTTPSAKGILGSPPTFGSSKPTFSFQPSPGFGGFTAKPQTKPLQEAADPVQQKPEQAQPKVLQQPQPLVQSQQHQVQQLQPQTQQQPPALTTQPQSTMAPFKLSMSQLGTPQTFPFGTSNVSFAPKPAAVAEQPKVSEPTGISFGLQPSASQKNVFSAKNVPQSTPIKQPEISVDKKTTPPITFSKKAEPVSKTEEVPAKADSETPETATVDVGVYITALVDEIDHFNSELQQLSSRVGNLDVQIGTEEDKIKMKKSIDGLHNFWTELKETTEGQSSEIHAIVMDLMEAFAWLEDAKSRNLQRKNPSYIELKKSEELDPLNARHMNEISHLKYYIENQLKQLTGYLEKEWMDHQENYRNEVKNKMAVPPLEEVYKTMHYQLKILHKQKALVEEIKERIAQKKRKNKFHSFVISASNSTPCNTNGNRASELSKLAENLLQLKINKEDDSPQLGAWEIMKSQLTAIAERSKKLTREKQNALRDMLSERDMVKIRPVKTTFESSTFLRSLHPVKTAATTPKTKTFFKFGEQEQKDSTPVVVNVPKPETEVKADSGFGKSKTEEKFVAISKNEVPKSVNAPAEKAIIPLTVESFGKKEEKSPLASLSGIVSALGSAGKNDNTGFVFRSSNAQEESSKEPFIFGAEKQDQKKQEETKISQPFTFGTAKPTEPIFGNNEATVLGVNSTFNLMSSITVVMTKNETTKIALTPSVTITPITTTSATTSSFSFTPVTTTSAAKSISFPAVTTTSPSLPKVNLFFGAKETSSGFGTPLTTESIFSAASTTASPFTQFTQSQNSPSSFGVKTTSTFTAPTSLFGVPKTSSETQPSGFSITPSSEVKSSQANDPVPTIVKPMAETEEVDVVGIDEPSKKSDQAVEKSKDSPKATATPSTSSSSTPPKTTPEVTSTVSASVTTVSVPLSTPNVFSKPVTTAVATTSSETPISTVTTASSSTPATTTSVFSFASATPPVFFGSTPTTTTTTTTTSLFETSTTSTSIFGQVSSTTPTASIFGGSTPSTPTTNLFGGSTPVKASTDQSSTPVTTSENIFGGSTPTTLSFGLVSTPNTTTSFGQTSNASVDSTANLFGQLLTDSNKSVFGGSSTPTTANNFFTSPKTTFEGTSTTTASLFGSSFGTSVFGQPTTTASIFGQPQTTTSNSFFGSGQNIFSGFGKGTTATPSQGGFKTGGFSEPVFGQSAFGQGFNRTNNPSAFGGTSGSIFGGAPTATTGNVFQTPTTSTTFGSTSPGPFSGGNSSFGESGFGSSPNTFQKPMGGFGSQPVFGGGPAAPAFGGSPTFGGSPSFGSLPTFGSVSQGAFGQSSGSTTFENLANQNTVGFGNLAQQSQGQGFGGGFGSPSFENKPAFGGNSFSNWRSK